MRAPGCDGCHGRLAVFNRENSARQAVEIRRSANYTCCTCRVRSWVHARAQVAELADAGDSKSPTRKGIRVRPPAWALQPYDRMVKFDRSGHPEQGALRLCGLPRGGV